MSGKKKTIMIIFSIIIILVLVILSLYFGYFWGKKSNNVSQNNNNLGNNIDTNNGVQDNVDNEFEIDDIPNSDIYEDNYGDIYLNNDNNKNLDSDVVDSLGRILYDRISYVDWDKAYFFKENYVSQASFTDSEKLHLSYMIIPGRNIDSGLANNCDGVYECIRTRAWMVSLKDATVKLWGSNNGIRLTSFSGYTIGECKVDENDDIECIPAEGLGGGCEAEANIYYDGAILDNDNIIVTVKYLLMEPDGKCEYMDLYADPEKKHKIKDLSDKNEVLFENEDLFEKYANQAGVFKVIFKRDSYNNNYYFYSSEYQE